MSIGRIGADESVSEKLRGTCRKALTMYFINRGSRVDRPFAALALGLCGGEREATLIRTELGKLRGSKNALGAQALALGRIAAGGGDGGISRIALDHNYRASVPAMEEVLRIP